MNRSIKLQYFRGVVLVAAVVLVTVGVAANPLQAAPGRWTCSMHPQIILPDNSQQCPLCFMDLIPLNEESGAGLHPNELSLTEAAIALAEVEVHPVRRAAAAKSVRLVGKVAPDQSSVSTITARFGGRLERLHVDATGHAVTRGAKLAEIYSPELYAAQSELRSAADAAAGTQSEAFAGQAAATLQSVVSRLRLWGLQQNEIDSIIEQDAARELWPITAPASGVVLSLPVAEGDYVRTGSVLYTIADLNTVWAVLEAWESDVAWLSAGQLVQFSARAFPGRLFEGRILFIEPVMDERSRTVAVRVEVANPEGQLKPGMLVSAQVEVPLGSGGVPAESPGQDVLLIPDSAPLLTGDRAVVYVRLPGAGQPIFAGREVLLGTRAGDQYVVLDGLEEGELVVTRGNFKIDSALQIQAKTSMMNPVPNKRNVRSGHMYHALTTKKAATKAAISGPNSGVAHGNNRIDWADEPILVDYLALQSALAGDDDASAAEAAIRLKSTVISLGDEDPVEPDKGTHPNEAWIATLKSLTMNADRVAIAADIASRRVAFQPLSDDLWAVLEMSGPPEGQTLRRFHCPMAMDGAGADWIQEGKTTANPYYGAMMLRCGSQVGVLGSATHADGH